MSLKQKVEIYFIPIQIREVNVNFGLICDVKMVLQFRHNVDALILKFFAKFTHPNGSLIHFQSNLNDQIKYFLDAEQMKRETKQKKQCFLFEFYNNNLVVIYKKNRYMKLNKNGQIVNEDEYCQSILETQKQIFKAKIYQMKEVYINIFKFIGVIRNNLKLIPTKKCFNKQKFNNIKNERKAILDLQKRLQKVLSNDCMIVIKNLFQHSMMVTLQPKITERSVVLQKLRVRNNEKKRQREEDYFKQMSMVSDVLNNELKQMIETIFKDIVIGSDTTNIFQILNIDEDQKIELQIIGGVSVVQKVDKIKLKFQPENSNEIREQQFVSLAKKMFKQNSQIKNLENNKKRFTRELEIIKYICTKSQKQKIYLPKYYYIPDNNKAYYSTWYPISLSSYLQTLKVDRDKFQLEEVLYLCIQIVLIVIDLHSSGVVHRDLKPSNFVVNVEGSHPKLILIDFSQSMIIQNEGRQVEEQNLTVYSTPIYCPLEASTFSKEYKSKGLIKTEIDRWSVGILIYEILHRFVPISYSSSTLKDIHTLWQTQFLQQFNMKSRCSIDKARQLIQFATFNLLHVKQEERMELQRILGILLICRSYCREITQLYIQQTLNHKYD